MIKLGERMSLVRDEYLIDINKLVRLSENSDYWFTSLMLYKSILHKKLDELSEEEEEKLLDIEEKLMDIV